MGWSAVCDWDFTDPTLLLFESIHINSNFTQNQDEEIRILLQKHNIDIFSKDDCDIGDCDMIRHRIDLVDDIPFKQMHRRIPPSIIKRLETI